MTEFFFFLVALIIGWFLLSLRKPEQKIEVLMPKERHQPQIAPAVQKPMNVVARSVEDIVGTYQDLTIYRYVQLDDDRMFIFESVAVERSPGVYHADETDSTYIIVDKCLLYREVQVELDK